MIAFDLKENLIGDTLATIPYILFQARRHKCEAYVRSSFNRAVRPLIAGIHPILFDDPPVECPTFAMDLSAMWHHCEKHKWPWNMAQGYFAYYGEAVPELPLTYDMNEQPTPLLPGIILSPYSRTNNPADNNKLWPHERWVQLLHRLQANGLNCPVYVIGSDASADDFAPYDKQGFVKLFNRSLPQILYMMRASPLVLTLDNGIGHLCHFGAVKRHVMIYAHVLPPKFAESPFAQHVRARLPIEMTVDDVLRHCDIAMACL